MNNVIILHADVDEAIKPYLINGVIFSDSVTPESLDNIKNKETIEILSVKSQSKITSQVLKAFPKLKLLIARTAGIDYIDTKECEKRHIRLINIPDYGANTIAEYTLALILAGARNIIQADREVKKGNFSYQNFLGLSLYGKTVGIIGTGRIGIELIKLLKPFNCRIIAYDIYQNIIAAKNLDFNYVNLKQLLKKSDIISIHIPLTADTKYLINNETLDLIKPASILVNTSRGEIIDTQALIKHSGKFKTICLDVIENEVNFNKKHQILKLSNLIITPHMAFYSDVSVKNIGKMTMEIIEKFTQ